MKRDYYGIKDSEWSKYICRCYECGQSLTMCVGGGSNDRNSVYAEYMLTICTSGHELRLWYKSNGLQRAAERVRREGT